MDSYYYKPLSYASDIRIIRLLDLLPSNDPTSTIECKFSQVNLADKPEYEALSYCWGASLPSTDIICDGSKLSIRENLHDALKELRPRPMVEKGRQISRTVWIDALCINQDDVEERNRQVQIMRFIYQEARKVVVWLGKESSRGIGFAKGLIPGITPTLGKYMLSDPLGFAAFQQLCLRPWFSRVWVIQEIVFAQDIQVLCGMEEISWETFYNAVEFCIIISNEWRASADGVRGLTAAFYLHTTRLTYRAGMLSTLHPTFLRHRLAQSTDPRDKIFALLSITSNPDSFPVNYGLDLETVFRDAILYILESDRNLDALATPRATGGLVHSRLPSWVPNWAATDSTWEQLGRRAGIVNIRFASTKESSMNLKVCLDKNIIVLSGFAVDIITETAAALDLRPGGAAATGAAARARARIFRSTMHDWVKVARLRSKKSNYITGETVLDAFRHTIVAGHPFSGFYDAKSLFEAFWKLYRLAALRDSLKLSKIPIFKVYLNLFNNPLRLKNIEFMRGVGVSGLCRRIARSRDGYLALVPETAQVGDTIALLKGGSTPFIIRPHQDDNNRWQVVGDAYVHGLMNGEKFEDAKCKPMTFV